MSELGYGVEPMPKRRRRGSATPPYDFFRPQFLQSGGGDRRGSNANPNPLRSPPFVGAESQVTVRLYGENGPVNRPLVPQNHSRDHAPWGDSQNRLDAGRVGRTGVPGLRCCQSRDERAHWRTLRKLLMARLPHFFLTLAATFGFTAAVAVAQEKLPPPVAVDPLHLPETLLPELKPILATALEAAPRVLQGRLAVAIAQAGEEEARAGLYPTLRVGAGVDGRQELRRDLPGTQYSVKFSYGLLATQPLFHWGALANRARLGTIQRALAEHDFAEARRKLVLEVRAQYTALVVRALELRQATEDDSRAGRRLATDATRAARGELAELDFAEEKLAREQSRRQLERLAWQWNQARADFAALAGLENFTASVLPAEIPALSDDWVARLKPDADPSHKSQRPDALAGPDLELAAARLNYEIAHVRLKPMFDLVAGITQDEVSYTANIAAKFGADIRYVGLRMNWNIFDSGASRAAASRARADVKQKTLALDEATRGWQRQLADGWRELMLAQDDLQLAEEIFTARAARLAADRPRQAAGEIAVEDWAQRLADQEQRRLALQRQRAAQLLRVAEYALLRERDQSAPHFP